MAEITEVIFFDFLNEVHASEVGMALDQRSFRDHRDPPPRPLADSLPTPSTPPCRFVAVSLSGTFEDFVSMT